MYQLADGLCHNAMMMMIPPPCKTSFADAVIRWQKKHGRHDLPWQQNPSAYTVWLSETMLQQTQVTTVIPYYHRFLCRFSNIATLARAHQDSVLALWSGLGYYARARNLHKAAKQMASGGIPTTTDGWQALPGVGKSTAAAIMVFTQGEKAAILDGNVRRILARTHAFPRPTAEAMAELWELADSLLPPKKHIRAYTQGLMDLGALICHRSRPQCDVCPLTAHCLAYQHKKTADYPVRRRKTKKPEKSVCMLLAHTDEEILLEKRPSHGIWGGLWALPEATNKQHLLATWRLSSDDTPPLYFTHEFTHYRLYATVYIHRHQELSSPTTQWIKIKNLPNLGLPAPIRKLLEKQLNG